MGKWRECGINICGGKYSDVSGYIRLIEGVLEVVGVLNISLLGSKTAARIEFCMLSLILGVLLGGVYPTRRVTQFVFL